MRSRGLLAEVTSNRHRYGYPAPGRCRILVSRVAVGQDEEVLMRLKKWGQVATVLAVAAPIGAHASTLTFDFTGPTMSGRLAVSFAVDTNTAAVLGASPNTHDPVGSFIITGVTGTVSDTTLNIKGASVTGLEPLNPVSPEPTNLQAPSRFSLLTVANGVDDGSGHPSPGFHYDNILYPAGSPLTSTDYPFSGGIFDIYGVAFVLDDGNAVNLWSNGVVPGAGLNYGVAITNRTDVLDYTGGVSIQTVPEPASWAIMLGGLGILGGYLRGRRSAVMPS